MGRFLCCAPLGLCFFFALFTARVTLAQVTFHDLSLTLADPGYMVATALSKNGETVVGEMRPVDWNTGTPGQMSRGFYWERGAGFVFDIVAHPSLIVPQGHALSVSDDGFTIFTTATASVGLNFQPYLLERYGFPNWTPTSIFNFISSNLDHAGILMSGDGQVLLGTVGATTRWHDRASGQYAAVDPFPNEGPHYLDLSRNGNVAVGRTYDLTLPLSVAKGFVWMRNAFGQPGTFRKIGFLNAAGNVMTGEARAVSSDGTRVAGFSKLPGIGYRGFVWNTAHTLPGNSATPWVKMVPGGGNVKFETFVNDLTDNGDILVGQAAVRPGHSFIPKPGTPAPPWAMRWICNHATGEYVRENLEALLMPHLPNMGPDGGYDIIDATHVSADGSVIVGSARKKWASSGPNMHPYEPGNPVTTEVWVAVVPVPTLPGQHADCMTP